MSLSDFDEEISSDAGLGVSPTMKSSLAGLYTATLNARLRLPALYRARHADPVAPSCWNWTTAEQFVKRLIAGNEPFGWTHYQKVEPSRAALTALRYDPQQAEFYMSNEARGSLLWLLVNSLKASKVIEYGTGRGFSALSIAHSLKSLQSEGSIAEAQLDTLDRIPVDVAQSWPREIQNQMTKDATSLRDIWDEMDAPESKLVRFLTGDSLRCTPQISGPYDFAFIDAGHDFLSVWADLTSLALSNREAQKAPSILFDDVGGKIGSGVMRAIAMFVLPFVEQAEVSVIAMPIGEAERREVGYHAMMYFDARRCGPGLKAAFKNLIRPGIIYQLYCAKFGLDWAKATLRPVKKFFSKLAA